MKNWKFRTGVILVLMAFTLSVSTVYAQRERYDSNRRGDGREIDKHSNNHSRYDKLELTDEQKGKMEEIKLSTSKEALQRQNKINELEAQLTTALTQDNVDQKKVNNLIDDIGKLKAEGRKETVGNQIKIRDLLTDEQKIIFDQQRLARNSNRDRHYYK